MQHLDSSNFRRMRSKFRRNSIHICRLQQRFSECCQDSEKFYKEVAESGRYFRNVDGIRQSFIEIASIRERIHFELVPFQWPSFRRGGRRRGRRPSSDGHRGRRPSS